MSGLPTAVGKGTRGINAWGGEGEPLPRRLCRGSACQRAAVDHVVIARLEQREQCHKQCQRRRRGPVPTGDPQSQPVENTTAGVGVRRPSAFRRLLLYPPELRAPCAVGNLVTGLRLQQQPRVGAWSARPYPLGGASARPPMPTRRSRMRIARLVMPALVLAFVPALHLADRSDQDPPSRVGRLSFLSGSVSLRPGSVDDWATATVNYPLTTGDHLWTDADARA